MSGKIRNYAELQALIRVPLRWSTRSMAGHLGVSKATVQRVWWTNDITAPHPDIQIVVRRAIQGQVLGRDRGLSRSARQCRGALQR